jgi:hypothetical protein
VGRDARLSRDAREEDERLNAKHQPALPQVAAEDPKRAAIAAALARARLRAKARPE